MIEIILGAFLVLLGYFWLTDSEGFREISISLGIVFLGSILIQVGLQ